MLNETAINSNKLALNTCLFLHYYKMLNQLKKWISIYAYKLLNNVVSSKSDSRLALTVANYFLNVISSPALQYGRVLCCMVKSVSSFLKIIVRKILLFTKFVVYGYKEGIGKAGNKNQKVLRNLSVLSKKL